MLIWNGSMSRGMSRSTEFELLLYTRPALEVWVEMAGCRVTCHNRSRLVIQGHDITDDRSGYSRGSPLVP